MYKSCGVDCSTVPESRFVSGRVAAAPASGLGGVALTRQAGLLGQDQVSLLTRRPGEPSVGTFAR
jgi:hypothetical protein